MNIFRRLYKLGKAEANAMIDKMEDPIRLTEEGIRDLKEDLSVQMEDLAQIKSKSIRSKNKIEELINKADALESKALLTLQKAQQGALEMEEADKLAGSFLVTKEDIMDQIEEEQKEAEILSQGVEKVETQISKVKSDIHQWENELNTLKARVRISKATEKLNKQMAGQEPSGTIEMLERMRDKVAQEEALARAYEEIAEEEALEEKLHPFLESNEEKAKMDLLKLKEKLGIKKSE